MSNFHAYDANGRNYPTKKALREAVAAYVANGQPSVYFMDTSAFGNRGRLLGPASLTSSDVIVGPDPYHDRRWYANVKNGKVV